MALRNTTIGARVFAVDDDNGLLFTKTEIDVAKQRYIKESAKKLAKQQ